MVDDEFNCVQTLDEHDQFQADLQNKLKSVKILKNRKPIDTPPVIMSDFCRTDFKRSNTTANCTDPEIYHCIERISLRTCKSDTNQSATFTLTEFGESFISDELSIHVHHNFTHILNVTVFFIYRELNGDIQTTHIVQKISVEFLELNETFATRDVHQVSGNIGYLLHKPVIVSRLVYQNYSAIDLYGKRSDHILAYFHDEINCTNDEHYLKLPAIQTNGDCLLNNFTFQTINFGEKSRIKCNIFLTPTESNDTDAKIEHSLPQNVEQNNTIICRNFQKQIFQYLLYNIELENENATVYNRFNLKISEMGNPKNDSEHWIDVRTMRAPNLDDIVAVNSPNGILEFTCTNMVLGVRYELFYGTMLVGKISNQALIKVAQIQFGNRLNLKFKLDDDVLKVPVYIDVMFYDFSRVVGNAAQTKPQIYIIIYLTLLIRLWQ